MSLVAQQNQTSKILAVEIFFDFVFFRCYNLAYDMQENFQDWIWRGRLYDNVGAGTWVIPSMGHANSLNSAFHLGSEYMFPYQWGISFQEIKLEVHTVVAGIHYGFGGQHAAGLPFENIILSLKFIYCAEILYFFAISSIKFSILLFYRRVFPVRQFVIVLWVIGCVSMAWMIAIVLSFVFQCSSVAKAWKSHLDGQFVDVGKLILGNAIVNIVIDIVIMLASLPLIWKLKITLNKKAVCRVFLIGGL